METLIILLHLSQEECISILKIKQLILWIKRKVKNCIYYQNFNFNLRKLVDTVFDFIIIWTVNKYILLNWLMTKSSRDYLKCYVYSYKYEIQIWKFDFVFEAGT